MKPIARQEELVIQELADEVLIYDLRINKAICLNRTSALIWQNCDGQKEVAEIAEEIRRKLNKTVSEDLIWFALDQLKKENLLVNGERIESKFKGLSRRDVIKRIGIATAAALPMVSSIVAPTSVYAQLSCAPPASMNPAGSGCPCASPAECIGGPCPMDGMC